MISFIFWLGPIGLLKTITAIFVGALIYGFLIFLFKGFNRNELKFLKELLRIKA
jgi:ABC-type uncharacterized transport system permease subunit